MKSRKDWEKEYYQKNKEKIKEYYQKNKEKIKGYQIDYYNKHKEKIIERVKNWQNTSEKDKLYRKNNKNKRCKQAKEWINNNRAHYNKLMLKNYYEDKSKWYSRNRAYKKIKISIDKICDICKDNKATERHHEDYNKPLQISYLCKDCHEKLHHNKDKEKMEQEIICR